MAKSSVRGKFGSGKRWKPAAKKGDFRKKKPVAVTPDFEAKKTSVWVQPVIADEALNPGKKIISDGQLSPGMRTLLGMEQQLTHYVVVVDLCGQKQHIRADGFEVDEHGRLAFRRGMMIVAQFNQWKYLLVIDKEVSEQ